MNLRPPFPHDEAVEIVRRGLAEDLGRRGDVTSDAIFPEGREIDCALVAREALTVAGLELADIVFAELASGQGAISVERLVEDGQAVEGGEGLARIGGDARVVLAGERLLLNLVARLCGIASETAEAVKEVAGTGARVADTRKTTPGLRVLEKYAVAIGGGENHRMRLDDLVLVKDNHKELAGGLPSALTAVKLAGHELSEIEAEVETLDEVRIAVDAGVGWILLDNMTAGQVRDAVAIIAGRCRIEVSGGLVPGRLRPYAEAGVDRLSMGYLTHGIRSRDLALDLVRPG